MPETAREMANVIFMWDDAVTEIPATIEDHSTEVSGFAAENLLDADRQTCFKTSATGDNVFVEFDLASAVAVKGFSIHNHNANTKGVSNLIIKRKATTPADSQYVAFAASTVTGDDDFFYKFSATQTYRYWRIEFDSVDSSGLYMGRIGLWREAYQLDNGIHKGIGEVVSAHLAHPTARVADAFANRWKDIPLSFLHRQHVVGTEDQADLLLQYLGAFPGWIQHLEHNEEVVPKVLHLRALSSIQDIF